MRGVTKSDVMETVLGTWSQGSAAGEVRSQQAFYELLISEPERQEFVGNANTFQQATEAKWNEPSSCRGFSLVDRDRP